MKRILVCGGRDFTNKGLLYNTLYTFCEENGLITPYDEYSNYLPTVTIIHGGATGADSIADEWAVVNWCPVLEFKADWDKYGKSAGPIRNQQMLDEGKPDICIAFPTAKSRGTWDMVNRCRDNDIPLLIITGD